MQVCLKQNKTEIEYEIGDTNEWNEENYTLASDYGYNSLSEKYRKIQDTFEKKLHL